MQKGRLEKRHRRLCQKLLCARGRLSPIGNATQIDAARMLQLGHQAHCIAALGQQLQVGVVSKGAGKALLAVVQLGGTVERHLEVALGQCTHGRKVPWPLRRSVS